MSAPQGSSACPIMVDPSTADVLRVDLLTDIGADRRANEIVVAEIHHNRHATEALNRVFDAYSDKITI
jgi:hypothetical protein